MEQSSTQLLQVRQRVEDAEQSLIESLPEDSEEVTELQTTIATIDDILRGEDVTIESVRSQLEDVISNLEQTSKAMTPDEDGTTAHNHLSLAMSLLDSSDTQ